jgi:hypothetical protein
MHKLDIVSVSLLIPSIFHNEQNQTATFNSKEGNILKILF